MTPDLARPREPRRAGDARAVAAVSGLLPLMALAFACLESTAVMAAGQLLSALLGGR